jgi:hypothetical protein
MVNRKAEKERAVVLRATTTTRRVAVLGVAQQADGLGDTR